MRAARAALTFLTRVPGGALDAADFARAPGWFAAVGLLVGVVQAGVWLVAETLWPGMLAAVVAVAFAVLLTGGLHEDGLADTFDGLGSGRPSDRALEIMRDSRIGSFGAIALLLVMALRIGAYAGLGALAPIAMIAGQAVSRGVMTLTLRHGGYLRAQGSGSGMTEAQGATGLMATAGAVAVALGLTIWAANASCTLAAIFGALVLAGAVVAWSRRRLGGVTGDILGAVQIVAEVGFALGLLACL